MRGRISRVVLGLQASYGRRLTESDGFRGVGVGVVVEVDGQRFELDPGSPFTFGRDAAVCTLGLGVRPLDRGISRVAGSISHENGLWWITNRSTTRSLHVIDVDTGIGIPLPVARANWPAPVHPVAKPLTILVTGEIRGHAISVRASADDVPVVGTLPATVDTVGTRKLLPPLTDKQREALVALVEGYLLPFPHYRPEPRTYEEAASRLGLPASTVRKRIENVRHQLVQAGVANLEAADARRNLAEWMLANRLINAADHDWLRAGRGPTRAT